MISKLHILASEDTPSILFDPDNGVFEIAGRSLPENANTFFVTVLEWLNSYFKDPLPESIFSLKLDYFNSASAKKIVEILLLLESQYDSGYKMKVLWYFRKNDFTMQKKGNDLLSIFGFPYEIFAQ